MKTQHLVSEIDIVTVVFCHEVPLLRLQARSIAQFFPLSFTGKIFVIVNDLNEGRCLRLIQEMLDDYGMHKDKVVVVTPSNIIRLHTDDKHRQVQIEQPFAERRKENEYWKKLSGWKAQQALKLLSVNVGNAPYVLILDAKNHFLDDILWSDLIAEDGRARTRYVDPKPKQVAYSDASYEALGLTRGFLPDRMPPTITPMVMTRSYMKDAVDFIQGRLGPLEHFFSMGNCKCSEFMLLHAFGQECHGGWDAEFAEGLIRPVTIFTSCSDEMLDSKLRRAKRKKMKIFSIHRRRFPELTAEQIEVATDVWIDRGFFSDPSELSPIFEALGSI